MPGAQAERTALAWQRTGVASSAVAGLAVLTAARDRSWWLLGVVAVLAAVAGAAGFLASRDGGRVHAGAGTAWPRLLATVTATLAVAAAGLLLALYAVLPSR